MQISLDELTPEESARHERRMILRSQLMGESKQANGGKATCTLCKGELTNSRARLLRITPPSLGGETDRYNAVLACMNCCTSKAGRSLEEWEAALLTQLGGIHQLKVKAKIEAAAESPEHSFSA